MDGYICICVCVEHIYIYGGGTVKIVITSVNTFWEFYDYILRPLF